MALDPLRPLDSRLAAARLLDDADQRKLEVALLEDLPELWGLEWRERLALLGAVGSRSAAEALEDLRASGALPASPRAQGAIDQTLARIESRLALENDAAPDRPRADS